MTMTRNPLVWLVGGFVLLVLMSATFFRVPETSQAIVVRLGKPNRIINAYDAREPFGQTGAGLVAKIPFIESVIFIDKRVMDLDMPQQTVLSTDQLRLNVDAYARYRIIDPIKMVQTAGTLATVESQLGQVLSSVVRQELGRRSFTALLAAERGSTMANIRTKLDAQARKYGAQVIDVRIKRADLPDGTPLESAFRRMQSARQQEAATLRAQGQKNGQIIRAEAEAQAAKIYAAAYGKDPAFYDFYRAMQSYDTTFAADSKSSSTFVLDPNNEYLRQFRGSR